MSQQCHVCNTIVRIESLWNFFLLKLEMKSNVVNVKVVYGLVDTEQHLHSVAQK